MVEINIDIQKLRALPLQLKIVAGVIAFDLIFLGLGYLVLDDVMAERAAAVDKARNELATAKRQNAELRRQVDDYPMLRQRYDAAIASGLTTSFDRLEFVQYAQSQAVPRYLGDLHFRVADEAGEREHSKKYKVEMSRISFESGGLIDTEAMSFWESMLQQVKGHYRIVEASLERTAQTVDSGTLISIRHGNPLSLLKEKIDIQWIGVQPLDQEAKK